MHRNEGYLRVLVARNCDRTTGITSSNVANKLAYGEIVVLDDKGQIVDTTAKAQAANAIRFMIGTRDESPIITDLIYKKELTKVETGKFKQKQERKVLIGYDGTAGSIDVIPGNVYAIEIEHAIDGHFPKSAYETRVSYEAELTGETQFNIASKLRELLALNYSQFEEGLRINILSSEAGAVGPTGCEVMRGVKTVTYTGGTAPAIGQAVKFPGLTGIPGRDEDDTVYKVVYVDTINMSFELDVPYQNRDQSGIAATIIADTSVGDYGIAIEGMAIKQHSRLEGYFSQDFDVLVMDFGSTLVQKDGTALMMHKGIGRHEDVIELENVYGDGTGRNNIQSPEYQKTNINTDVGTGYSVVSLVFNHTSAPNVLNTHVNPKEIMVFLQRGTYEDIEADAAGTAFGTNIQTGTGLSGVDASSFLNVINAFAVDAGVLNSGANTTPNGGNEVTAGTTYSTGIDV